MSMKNLAREVESIALALSEEGGYEYYHIDDELRELAKDVSDMQAENAKLRELLEAVLQCAGETKRDKGCDACPMYNGLWRNDGTWCLLRPTLRELGVDE